MWLLQRILCALASQQASQGQSRSLGYGIEYLDEPWLTVQEHQP